MKVVGHYKSSVNVSVSVRVVLVLVLVLGLYGWGVSGDSSDREQCIYLVDGTSVLTTFTLDGEVYYKHELESPGNKVVI